MKSIKGLTLFIVGLTLIMQISIPGCDNEKSQADNEIEKPLSTVDPSIRSFDGYLMYGDEGFLFKSAPDGNYFILSGELDDLLARYNELTFMEYEPVYARLNGFYLDASVGYSAGCDGAIEVTEVESVEYVTRDLRIFPIEFKCYGEEPFWSIDVITDDEIIFKDLSKDRMLYIQYTTPVEFEGTIIYELEYEDKKVVLNLEPTECFDTMSGERFEYTATFDIGGDTYFGCAEKVNSE